jgi:hypothetical protein
MAGRRNANGIIGVQRELFVFSMVGLKPRKAVQTVVDRLDLIRLRTLAWSGMIGTATLHGKRRTPHRVTG